MGCATKCGCDPSLFGRRCSHPPAAMGCATVVPNSRPRPVSPGPPGAGRTAATARPPRGATGGPLGVGAGRTSVPARIPRRRRAGAGDVHPADVVDGEQQQPADERQRRPWPTDGPVQRAARRHRWHHASGRSVAPVVSANPMPMAAGRVTSGAGRAVGADAIGAVSGWGRRSVQMGTVLRLGVGQRPAWNSSAAVPASTFSRSAFMASTSTSVPMRASESLSSSPPRRCSSSS